MMDLPYPTKPEKSVDDTHVVWPSYSGAFRELQFDIPEYRFYPLPDGQVLVESEMEILSRNGEVKRIETDSYTGTIREVELWLWPSRSTQ